MNVKHLLGAMAVLMGATTVAHGAQTWTVTVQDATTARLECPSNTNLNTCLLPTGQTNAFDNGATVTINCATAAVCQGVGLFRANGTAPISEVAGGAPTSPMSKVYTLTRDTVPGAANVGVFSQTRLLVGFTLQPNSATVGGGGGGSQPARNLEQVIAASNPIPLDDCPGAVQATYRTPDDDDADTEDEDDRHGDARSTAEVYVDALGNVIARPSESFDENDRLRVWVLSDEDLLQRLRVARTSEIRDVTVLRNIGSDVGAPLIERQARGDATCKMRPFEIDSFAPGRGVVTISRVNGNAVEAISTFDLTVAPLYSGIFTLGTARTEAVNPEYKLVANGADQVIAPGDTSDKDTLYAIYYTPFVIGKRDLEKPFRSSKWFRHINPTVGLVLDDVSDNFMVGLSIDLPRGILITAGRHYRKVDVLSAQSGLSVGSVFTGAPETIPTAKTWESVGISVDIRVMSQLFRNAFTSGE
jgi:hypothetical protein